MKHGSPLPSSYYALSALTATQRGQFSYCPHFIEEELRAQQVKPFIQCHPASKLNPSLAAAKDLMHCGIHPLLVKGCIR